MHHLRNLLIALGAAATAAVPATATGAERPANFLRDVMPILNRSGCTAGACHGAAKGKNGFKLSLRGYDAEFDYRALLFEVSGRRFNRAVPEASLMLAKPTMRVPHEGGLRLEEDSEQFRTIVRWISEGAIYGNSELDSVAALEVEPAEIRLDAPGLRQPLTVIARYGDGTSRDVSAMAVVESNSTSTASIEQDGTVVGERVGEAAIMVRYEGKFTTVPLTVLNPAPGFSWRPLPQHNYIDQHVDAKLRRLKIQPSSLASDAAFARRVHLDLTGIPPTPEQALAFLEDPDSSRAKRSRLIEQLVGSPEYIDHWSLKWGDLLQSNRKHLGEKGMWAFRQWIRDAIASNQPYDEFVRELLTSSGSTFQSPAANFFRINDDPKLAMETTSQLFLGVRMVCAQCHDHPFERWTQNQYFQLAAFFSAVGMKPGFDSDEQIVYLKRGDARFLHPKTNKPVEPEYLLASADMPAIGSYKDSRQALSQWLTSADNPYFARAIANRVWSYFFGRGIIEPVDDIRGSNPAVNPALLNTLERDFVQSGFDLQHLIRTIVSSRTYQAAMETNEWNASDDINFSRFHPRRLPAESMLDAITIATGARPDFPAVPEDFTAQQLPDPHVDAGGFLNMFGRPERESPCECERRNDLSLPLAMSLVNGPVLADAIAHPDGRIAKALLAGRTDRELVEELYLASLGRFPTTDELDGALSYLGSAPGRAAQAQDLLWALVNSNAFLFNR